MVESRVCSFCGERIEPGTGRMYIKRDATVLYFCSNKCFKNMIILKRDPKHTRWTKRFIGRK
ncbi:MAG: 50S ribosomal protein L24e [Thermoplasmata archaeon]|nr:50S ribosomal protein L24e [Thermoplasmata archaeon]OYT49349.1 MAG: 50S ribosomal protein L24e [Thermoplasmatales archaeon ex4484_36]HDD60323.1 50S ribosomal protein L24e [Euryarchaeota archaeon]RLF53852.1 MAG: 50S ribosomal protein L24e [Thermoplasmata archaeon]RLF69424.1 MAG: 50S ribosomal protein L24e [Thermoplasmata archaeon]